MRWNVDERVQVFTGLLFTLLVNIVYWAVHDRSFVPNPGRMYFTLLFVCFGITLTLIYLLAKQFKNRTLYWLTFFGLISSQTWMAFTSSGLETPFTFLLLGLFFLDYFRKITRPISNSELSLTFLWASLTILNRFDTALIVIPACFDLFLINIKRQKWKMTNCLLAAAFPLVTWFLFATIYFGFPLPNTYYTKIGFNVETGVRWAQGLDYLTRCLNNDFISVFRDWFSDSSLSI